MSARRGTMSRMVMSLLMLWGSGCGGSFTGPENAMAAESFENRELFRSTVGTSYRYFYQNECACPPAKLRPVEIEVLDGTIRSVVDRADGSRVAEERWGDYLTVLDVFAAIDSALAGGADFVQATYDDRLGYPRNVLIDFEERIGIDDLGYSIDNLSIIDE